MSVKPELILHIGMGKTGTTALQETFWQNRKTLESAGVLYPSLGSVASAHHLISPRVPPVLDGNGWTFLKPEDWAPKLAVSGAKRILMSSELIAWASADVAAQFIAVLRQYFEVKICIYLRRQDNIIMAGYNQGVKAGSQINPIGLALKKAIESYDYSAILSRWEEAVGAANMIVRPYERVQFINGDLIDDFILGVLGIAVPEDFKKLPKENSNPRFSHIALEYKRLINCVFPKAEDSGAYTAPLLEFSKTQDSGATAVFFEHGLLSVQDRSDILAHFAPLNAAMGQKFLGRPDFFAENLSSDAAVAPPVTDQEISAISNWLSAHQPKLAKALLEGARTSSEGGRPFIRKAAMALLTSFGNDAPPRAAPKAKQAYSPDKTRRVIIHTGLPKTGTSAIQEAFFKNRKALLQDHGLLYPGLDENHTQPILALFRKDALKNVRFANMTPPSLIRYQAEVKTKLEAEIRASDRHTLLLSGEGISTLKVEEWQEFLDWLRGMGLDQIEVVFSVRDGIDLARRTIQQNIKSGLLLESQFENPPVLRSRARLMPIMKSLGRDRISIWDFDKGRKSDAGLLDHFCKSLGLTPQVCALISQTSVFQNESLSQPGVDALAARNRALGKPVGVSGAEHAHFLSMEGPKFTLPDPVVEKIRPIVDQDAAWLAKAFPTGGPRNAKRPAKDRASSLPAPLPAVAPRPAPRRSLPARLYGLAYRIRAIALQGRSAFSVRRGAVAQPEVTTAFVHFGSHKTGSSSIQQALFDAGDALESAAYVSCGVPNASNMVNNAFAREEVIKAKASRANVVPNIERLRQRGLADLTASLNRAVGKSNCIILSAEGISHFNEDELSTLNRMIGSYASTARYVGYVREPVSQARSVFQEILKISLKSPFEPEALTSSRMRYHEIVDRLDAQIGRENVLAFPFDRTLFPKGDVVLHFLQVVGIDPAKIETKRVNEGLSLLATKALYIYRRTLQPTEDATIFPKGRAEFLAAMGGLGGPAFVFAPEIDAALFETNQHIFDWAERRLNHAFPKAGAPVEGGVRQESDLMQISPDERDRFAEFAAGIGKVQLPAVLDNEAIAQVMHQIRLHFNQSAALQGRSAFSVRRGAVAQPEVRTAFVHFGSRKTGSSSIQRTLFDAAGTLGTAAYVSSGVPNSSRMVAFSIRKNTPKGGSAQVNMASNSESFRQLGRAELTSALDRAASQSNRLILSAESIIGFHEDELRALNQVMKSYAETVRYVGYVREPVSLARSMFQQLLKTEMTAPFDPRAFTSSKVRDHEIIDRLDAIIGRENVLAFPFDRALFPQGDVVSHFLQVVGIDPDKVQAKRVNEGLSLLATKALYIYRRTLQPTELGAASLNGRPGFFSALAGTGGPAFAFAPEIEAALFDTNQHIYSWAEKRLNHSFPRPSPVTEGGVRQESDLMTLTPEERERFAEFATGIGRLKIPGALDNYEVAQVMHQIRLHFHHADGSKRFNALPPR